mmetsp:Transcript_14451/g.23119  ORF Transcript_14451/g.23119 Transcript_14451/m.23119 type:complete len:254 (+) Transcript_14451:508-1269(+)
MPSVAPAARARIVPALNVRDGRVHHVLGLLAAHQVRRTDKQHVLMAVVAGHEQERARLLLNGPQPTALRPHHPGNRRLRDGDLGHIVVPTIPSQLVHVDWPRPLLEQPAEVPHATAPLRLAAGHICVLTNVFHDARCGLRQLLLRCPTLPEGVRQLLAAETVNIGAPIRRVVTFTGVASEKFRLLAFHGRHHLQFRPAAVPTEPKNREFRGFLRARLLLPVHEKHESPPFVLDARQCGTLQPRHVPHAVLGDV